MTKDIERTVNCDGIDVIYTDRTNGAGLQTKEDLVNTIEELFPDRTFKRCYEWCAGPAFYGYSLLGKQKCDTLFLADIFQPAIELMKKTAQQNNITDKVTIINSDNWQNIPESEKFDLIVSNPPHFCLQNYYNEIWTFEKRIYIDKDWNIHREFFAGVKQHLSSDGYIVLLECAWGSGVNTFQSMIDAAELKVVNHFIGKYHHATLGYPIYYIVITHK